MKRAIAKVIVYRELYEELGTVKRETIERRCIGSLSHELGLAMGEITLTWGTNPDLRFGLDIFLETDEDTTYDAWKSGQSDRARGALESMEIPELANKSGPLVSISCFRSTNSETAEAHAL